MKRICVVILVFACCLGLVACGGGNGDSQTDSRESIPSNSTQPSTVESTQPDDGNDVATFDYAYISSCGYYFDYNTSRRKAQKHTSTVFYSSGDDVYQAIWGVEKYSNDSVQNVLSTNTTITYDVDGYINAYFGGNNYSLVVESDKTTSISGRDYYNFRGLIKDENGQKLCNVYGYSFDVNGTPSMILGYEIDDAKMTSFCAEIDAVIESIRTER